MDWRRQLARLKPHLPVLLVFTTLALLPISRLVELPLVIMAVLGGRRLWREGRSVLADPRAQLLTLVFLAYWLPVLVSALDAVHPSKSWLVTLALPRYWLAGLYALAALRDAGSHDLLWRLSAWLVAFWTFDALFQLVVGYNLLGYPYPDMRLNGIFGMHNFKLGPVLALFSPLLIEHARRHWPRWLAAVAVLALITVVMLTVTRIGWIMLGVVFASYGFIYARQRPRRAAAGMLVLIVAASGVGLTAYQFAPQFRDTVDRSLRLFEGTRPAVNRALSLRIPVWEASWGMASDHWINGVGVRGFRYAYDEYAVRGDPFVGDGDGVGATYAHQLLLEIPSETGLIGLAGFAMIVVFMLRAWLRAPPERRRLMLPYGLALLAAVFPLNSHYAIYSTFWSITLWWLVMGYCAASDDRAGPT